MSHHDKLTASITFKCTPELAQEIGGLALVDDMGTSEWVRIAAQEKAARYRQRYECMSAIYGPTRETTLDPVEPEKTP